MLRYFQKSRQFLMGSWLTSSIPDGKENEKYSQLYVVTVDLLYIKLFFVVESVTLYHLTKLKIKPYAVQRINGFARQGEEPTPAFDRNHSSAAGSERSGTE